MEKDEKSLTKTESEQVESTSPVSEIENVKAEENNITTTQTESKSEVDEKPKTLTSITNKRANVIVVTSGKGGVGKTTTTANFGTALALRGKKVVLVDFDVGLRNLDLAMGCERRVVYDFVNVINKEATIKQALIKDKHCENLFVLPASQTRDKDTLTKDGVERVIDELSQDFDFIICDSPAGIENGALMALYRADEALIVTNPEISSVRDSDRILGILSSKSKRAEIKDCENVKEHLLITRYNPKRVVTGEMLSIDSIKEILGVDLIGVIPESEEVLQSSNTGTPAVHQQTTRVAQAYLDVADRFLGKNVPMRFTSPEKEGFFQRLFKRS